MPIELPFCRGEYSWSQTLPVPAEVVAVLHLPHRCSISASFGEALHRQSLSLSLVQSATGLGHLTVSELEHRGCTDEPKTTEDLFQLLLNTAVSMLLHHCERQVSLGGQVPCQLLPHPASIPLTWAQWGFQLLASTSPGRRRVLARVRNLKVSTSPSRTGYFPTGLSLRELRWRGD